MFTKYGEVDVRLRGELPAKLTGPSSEQHAALHALGCTVDRKMSVVARSARSFVAKPTETCGISAPHW